MKSIAKRYSLIDETDAGVYRRRELILSAIDALKFGGVKSDSISSMKSQFDNEEVSFWYLINDLLRIYSGSESLHLVSLLSRLVSLK